MKTCKIGKLILCLVYAVVVCLAFVACGEENASGTSESNAANIACEQEGAIDTLLEGNAKYGAYYFVECKEGKWEQISQFEITCGVRENPQEGDSCSFAEIVGYFYQMRHYYYYLYHDNAWEEVAYKDFKFGDCTEENEGVVDSAKEMSKGNIVTDYYKCQEGSWDLVSKRAYICGAKQNPQVGDTCRISASSLESGYFVYADTGWVDVGYEVFYLGECSEEKEGIVDSIVVGGETSYEQCTDGKWNYLTSWEYRILHYLGDCTEDKEGIIDSIVVDGETSYEQCIDGQWFYLSSWEYRCISKQEPADSCPYMVDSEKGWAL